MSDNMRAEAGGSGLASAKPHTRVAFADLGPRNEFTTALDFSQGGEYTLGASSECLATTKTGLVIQLAMSKAKRQAAIVAVDDALLIVASFHTEVTGHETCLTSGEGWSCVRDLDANGRPFPFGSGCPERMSA